MVDFFLRSLHLYVYEIELEVEYFKSRYDLLNIKMFQKNNFTHP